MAFDRKSYMREYQREWYRRRRTEFFADKSCKDCGAVDDLELDHRDPDSKITSAIWSWSQARRDDEIAKCDVRCESCHKARHAALLRTHGLSAYQKRNCRCEVCRAAKSAAMKRETRRQRAQDSNP